MSNEIVLAADLGGTNLRMAAIASGGEVIYRAKRATPRSERVSEIVRAIIDAAHECRENSQDFTIKAIAAAVPATVDVERGAIIKAPNLPALNGFQLSAALEQELGVKTLLENDANAAAVGESWLGASRNVKDSICVTLGTGIGGGIMTGGKILRGSTGTAGEIGHIRVEPYGIPCGCGSRGCVEQYASASAIVRLANELETQYPKSALRNLPKLSAQDVYRAGTQGDELALEVFRQMGFYLGISLGSLINVLNPEVIVIGGGAAAGWDLFMPHLLNTLNHDFHLKQMEQTRIVRAELGDDADWKSVV